MTAYAEQQVEAGGGLGQGQSTCEQIIPKGVVETLVHAPDLRPYSFLISFSTSRIHWPSAPA